MTGEQRAAPGAVIVISSHVVRGTVGNRAAVFALEHLGHRVWAVPTVTLPWHPGHGRATRIVPPSDQFAALLQDLGRAPWLDEVDAVLTGYLGDAEQAVAVAELVDAVKTRNPDALYLCDPVMGDVDGLYVPEATAAAMRDVLLPAADIATPNRFELEWLAGKELADNAALSRAASELAAETVLVTSAHAMMAGSIGNLLVTPREVLLAEHRAIANPPNGTGDLASALFLARRLQGMATEKALQMTAAAVFEVVARAVKRGSDELMLETDAQSLSHPMAMVQTRRLVTPGGRHA
ncbi:pyridoxal kinase PdxY [Mesorhizobium sp. CAU 1741]|uniref:pyridoxal kinase PdxY n=1 Tax=Mesorhizobium sp. CAU 1741 TaxID=3140366 RepID=UPI00325B0C19